MLGFVLPGIEMAMSSDPSAALVARSLLSQSSDLIPNQCDPDSIENADPINYFFPNQPIYLSNDTPDRTVARRLGYFFTLDTDLRQALEQAFAVGTIRRLDIEIVSQQTLYQARAEAQNRFDGANQQATIRLSAQYVIGDYASACAVSLAAIDNEFSEILLWAQYYSTYGRELQPSVFQESATLALSSLVSLLLQGETFQSAEEIRVFLQDTLARSQRSYAQNPNLSGSSPAQDSAFIAEWLNTRLEQLLPTPFADGTVRFVVDTSADRGNVIRPIVVAP